MGKQYIIEIVCEGGMTSLKEVPGQEKTLLRNSYFDEFTTYAPFNWLGSRRLSAKEFEEASKQIRGNSVRLPEKALSKTRTTIIV